MNFRQLFTRKRIIWTAIIIVVVGYIAYRASAGKGGPSQFQTDTVKRQTLEQTVLTTGQVVSSVDLELSFKSGGIVSRVSVKEGDKVRAGTVLASLDQRDQLATLTQAQGALASAQANYSKVLAGATSQDVEVSKAAVVSAQATLDNAHTSYTNTVALQQTTVANAYSALLNSAPEAVPDKDNHSTVTLTISGAYAATESGRYTISIANPNTLNYNVSGLEVVAGQEGSRTTPSPLGTRGLKLQFSATGTVADRDSWTVDLPNTQASTYLANYNAYQAALQTQTQSVASAQGAVASAQAALAQAQAALALKQAEARPADVDAARAQVLTGQGQVQAAEAALEHTLVRAPADGTVTQVNIKVGEQATAGTPVVVLQDVANLHLEANVSEADIASVSPNQSVDVTFDALGVARHFTAQVETVNPASTVISGVVNYKVKALLTNVSSEIKPGMTANMTIQVAHKDNVLAVPQQAVVTEDHSQYVRVVDDLKKKTYHQVKVETGITADGGLVEITGGLSEGQTVVTYLKP